MLEYTPHDPQTYIAVDLLSLAQPIDLVKPIPANAMVHSHDDLSPIADSLREFGQRSPIVILKSTNEILAGTGRWLACKNLLGWTHMAMIFSDDTPDAAARYNIADNATGRISQFNFGLLKDRLDEQNMIPGMTPDFVKLVRSMTDPQKADDEPETEKRKKKTINPDWVDIKISVPPPVAEAFQRSLSKQQGYTEWERFSSLIGFEFQT